MKKGYSSGIRNLTSDVLKSQNRAKKYVISLVSGSGSQQARRGFTRRVNATLCFVIS